MAEMLEFAVKMSMLFSGDFQGKFTQAAQSAQRLEQALQKTQNAGGQINKYQALQSSILKTSERLTQARERVRTLGTEMRKTPQPTSAMKREFTQANIEAHKLLTTLQNQRKQLGDLGQGLKEAGTDTRNLKTEQSRLADQTSKLKDAQDRLTQARSRYERIQGNLTWGNMKSTVLSAMGTFKVLEAPVKISGDFEEAMQKVKAVGFSSEGADLTQFYQMREQALRLGAETSFTSIQAANAQENLIRGGFNPTQTMEAMPALLNMAAAEGLDLGQAAAIIVGSLNTIGLKAKDAGKLADMFAYASANSSTNIANIGEAFKGTAATAHSMGVNAEQLTAILMTLANMQIESSEAGTAVSSTFARLSKEPKAVAESLAKYNIAIQTREGNMRTLPDIVKALYETTTPKGAKERMKAFADVFGLNYANAMIALAEGTIKGDTARYENELRTKAPGQAQRMTDINLDSLNGQLTILGSAIDGLKIALGDMFNPLVREGVELLTAAFSKLNEIIREFPNASKGVVYTVTLLAGSKAIAGILNIGKSILSLPGAWLEYTKATTAAGALTAAQTGLMSRVIFALSHPIAALKTGFTLLWGVIAAHPFMAIITVCTLIYAYWDDIKALGISMWGMIREKADEFLAWWDSLNLGDIWQSVKDSFNEMLDWLYAKWQDFKNFFSNLNPFASIPESAQARQVKNANTAMSGYMPPEIPAHAFGGILTQPHVGLVAEAGPEAIIPLRDKSRGREVLMQAANILGMNLSGNNASSPGTQNRFVQAADLSGLGASKNNAEFQDTRNILMRAGNIPGMEVLKNENVNHLGSMFLNRIFSINEGVNNHDGRTVIRNILTDSEFNLPGDNSQSGLVKLAGSVSNHEAGNILSDYVSPDSINSMGSSDRTNNNSFVINVNVDADNQSNNDLGMNIAERVREVIERLMQDRVRLNYA